MAQSLLHAWAAEIVSAAYSDAVSLENLVEVWQHRRRALDAAIAGEITTVSAPDTPAWLPDETWPQPYHRYIQCHQHDLGEFSTSPPPNAA
ncbi:hypothetical protein ED92_10610 [Amycolatopsis sp. MJM2582]|nr:hypothetical protein ED92_10610 [Amycolatopsis sp. MJM2582]